MLHKVCIITYGCSANKSDSEIMAGLLRKNNFGLINSTKNSDLNIINTCVVKLPTFNRMIYRIRQLTNLDKPLIVTGCITKTERGIVEKINPNASLMCPDSVEKIVDIAYATLEGKKIVALEDLKKPKLGLPRCRKNPVIGITQISRGCISNCSFCSEPYRGKLFSYPPKMIMEDVKQAVKDGCKEIWISSLDNGCYGFDIGANLPELLNEVCKVKGKFFVRVGMMNPLHLKRVLDDLIQVYKNEKIFKFLHIPVQSFSNKVLRDMKRGYTVKEFLACIKKFRKEIPDITVSVDIITGYPTETEEDHELNVQFLEKIEFDVVNLSRFGVRPNTLAGKVKELDKAVVNRRSKELSGIIKHMSNKKNQRWLGWEGEVLVDEIGVNRTFVSRNFAYKPIVIREKVKLGEFVKVKIIDAKTNHLVAILR